jgi:hypothetical protein
MHDVPEDELLFTPKITRGGGCFSAESRFLNKKIRKMPEILDYFNYL